MTQTWDPETPIAADSPFNPDIPEGIAMELLEPVFRDEEERGIAEKNYAVMEQCQRAAYAIWRNKGARNAQELDALIATGWKPVKRTRITPPVDAEDEEGVDDE